jgi:ubiquitin-activating enzyme E1
VLELAKQINEKRINKANLDDKVIKELSYQAQGSLSPMAAFFGGIVAQEALKVGHTRESPATHALCTGV